VNENKEIKALLHLIDDPDEDVYETVSEKLLSFGPDIIPNLENLWETISSPETQERIELLIHRVHLRELTDAFTEWKNGDEDLLKGALLVASYHYPDLQETESRQHIEKLRRNIWLELNNYLTPIERINVFNSIFYSYYKIQGTELNYENTDHFMIHKTLENKKGNSLSNGIIYLILCEMLDIPVHSVQIPQQFLLGYFIEPDPFTTLPRHASEKIQFYIDPLNGQMYSHKDIESYFKRISVPPVGSYFRPRKNRQVIRFLLEELAKCFDNERNRYKMKELLALAELLED
jgi:regulator of sirC expression with transglutaminase-like and TPR domain